MWKLILIMAITTAIGYFLGFATMACFAMSSRCSRAEEARCLDKLEPNE